MDPNPKNYGTNICVEKEVESLTQDVLNTDSEVMFEQEQDNDNFVKEGEKNHRGRGC